MFKVYTIGWETNYGSYESERNLPDVDKETLERFIQILLTNEEHMSKVWVYKIEPNNKKFYRNLYNGIAYFPIDERHKSDNEDDWNWALDVWKKAGGVRWKEVHHISN